MWLSLSGDNTGRTADTRHTSHTAHSHTRHTRSSFLAGQRSLLASRLSPSPRAHHSALVVLLARLVVLLHLRRKENIHLSCHGFSRKRRAIALCCAEEAALEAAAAAREAAARKEVAPAARLRSETSLPCCAPCCAPPRASARGCPNPKARTRRRQALIGCATTNPKRRRCRPTAEASPRARPRAAGD